MTILQYLRFLITGQSTFLVSFAWDDEEGTTFNHVVVNCESVMFPLKAIQSYADDLYPTLEGEISIMSYQRMSAREAQLFGDDSINLTPTKHKHGLGGIISNTVSNFGNVSVNGNMNIGSPTITNRSIDVNISNVNSSQVIINQ